MIEPTETETKEGLDGFIEVLRSVVREAEENPGVLREVPVRWKVKRLDEIAAARNPCLTGCFLILPFIKKISLTWNASLLSLPDRVS
jgi:glycine cleavage system protein P-like pyridoxal-binding family